MEVVPEAERIPERAWLHMAVPMYQALIQNRTADVEVARLQGAVEVLKHELAEEKMRSERLAIKMWKMARDLDPERGVDD
jgi:hypothetical protein